jgi:hypothetical protein
MYAKFGNKAICAYCIEHINVLSGEHGLNCFEFVAFEIFWTKEIWEKKMK